MHALRSSRASSSCSGWMTGFDLARRCMLRADFVRVLAQPKGQLRTACCIVSSDRIGPGMTRTPVRSLCATGGRRCPLKLMKHLPGTFARCKTRSFTALCCDAHDAPCLAVEAGKWSLAQGVGPKDGSAVRRHRRLSLQSRTWR